jgi:hypothetical protein
VGWVVGFFPEPNEILQGRAGTFDVWCRAGRKAVQFGVDRVALGRVFGLVQVAHLVEVAEALASVLELATTTRRVLVVSLRVGRQATQDLVADVGAWLEPGDELRDLRLNVGGRCERLIAAASALATGRAVVARLGLLARLLPVLLTIDSNSLTKRPTGACSGFCSATAINITKNATTGAINSSTARLNTARLMNPSTKTVAATACRAVVRRKSSCFVLSSEK